MQTLTLVSGGCTDAFAPQLAALENVTELVQKFLARDVISSHTENGKIMLKRRVFTKASSLRHTMFTLSYMLSRSDLTSQPRRRIPFRLQKTR